MLIDEREINSSLTKLKPLDMFNKTWRKALLAGCILVFFHIFTGVFAISIYSTPVFLGSDYENGITPTPAQYSLARNLTEILGAEQVLTVIPGYFVALYVKNRT